MKFLGPFRKKLRNMKRMQCQIKVYKNVDICTLRFKVQLSIFWRLFKIASKTLESVARAICETFYIRKESGKYFESFKSLTSTTLEPRIWISSFLRFFKDIVKALESTTRIVYKAFEKIKEFWAKLKVLLSLIFVPMEQNLVF